MHKMVSQIPSKYHTEEEDRLRDPKKFRRHTHTHTHTNI